MSSAEPPAGRRISSPASASSNGACRCQSTVAIRQPTDSRRAEPKGEAGCLFVAPSTSTLCFERRVDCLRLVLTTTTSPRFRKSGKSKNRVCVMASSLMRDTINAPDRARARALLRLVRCVLVGELEVEPCFEACSQPLPQPRDQAPRQNIARSADLPRGAV
jgi:hypothetical protein